MGWISQGVVGLFFAESFISVLIMGFLHLLFMGGHIKTISGGSQKQKFSARS